jgi:hypothetical protein
LDQPNDSKAEQTNAGEEYRWSETKDVGKERKIGGVQRLYTRCPVLCIAAVRGIMASRGFEEGEEGEQRIDRGSKSS